MPTGVRRITSQRSQAALSRRLRLARLARIWAGGGSVDPLDVHDRNQVDRFRITEINLEDRPVITSPQSEGVRAFRDSPKLKALDEVFYECQPLVFRHTESLETNPLTRRQPSPAGGEETQRPGSRQPAGTG